MRRSQQGRVAIAVVVALLLAACGSNGGSSVEPNSPSLTPSSAAMAEASAEESAAATAPTPDSSAAANDGATASSPTTAASSSTTASTPAEASSSAADPTATAFDPATVTIELREVASGLVQPLFLTHSADGTVFVVEKGGRIKAFAGGDFAEEPRMVLDIGARVGSRGSEQGLLGLALHPSFAENGYLYVNYTDRDGNTVVSRFTSDGELTVDPGSEQVLLRQEQPASNHNGGMLAFGPDGYLYIGLGDGGGANDSFGNGQNLATWLGTLLRVDVDGGEPYAIPPDNPFVNDNNARPEIWAYGLRNPWRFSFDRATDDLYIADVGQNQWEEISVASAGQGGQNYGWPILEGSQCFSGTGCDRTGLEIPVAEYSHEFGCSVTGGYVYRGQQFPALTGVYVFGDYCSGRMWTLSRAADGTWQTNDALQSDTRISSFGEDANGELYVTDLGTGQLFQVIATER